MNGLQIWQALQDRQRFFGLMPRLETRSILAELDRSLENASDGDHSSKLVVSNGGQAHRRDASTRRAVRIPTELAWRDFGPEVRRQCLSRERENAIAWALWRRCELANHGLGHV